MKFSIVAALATTAVAQWQPWDPTCLNQTDVDNLIAKEIIYLQHPDVAAARAIAYSIFTPDIVEYGDSINSLRGQPVSQL